MYLLKILIMLFDSEIFSKMLKSGAVARNLNIIVSPVDEW